MPPRPREGLTGIASACFIRKNETRSHPRHTQQEPKHRELLRITGQVLESARQVVKKTAKIKGVDVAGHLPSTNSANRSRRTATWARRSLTRPVGGYSTESRFLPTRRCTPSSSLTRRSEKHTSELQSPKHSP